MAFIARGAERTIEKAANKVVYGKGETV